MSGLCGAFAVEADHVGTDGFGAKLPQQRGHLSPMVGAVVGQMLYRLPQRVVVWGAFHVPIIESALQICGRESVYV